MQPIVAVIAPGMIGSGVGQRLVEHGVEVRTAPTLRAAANKPVYVDCNALNPGTVLRIARVIEATGSAFVDGGITA